MFIPDALELEWETTSDIATFLERSRCTLEQLTLIDAAVTNDGLVKLLKGTPLLRALWVEARKGVDCKFLSELRDDLPHLETLRLTLLHADAHVERYEEFMTDERRWWPTAFEIEEYLVEHGLAMDDLEIEEHSDMSQLENTCLLMKDSGEVVGGGYEGMYCAYQRGFDKLEIGEAEEDLKYTCRPHW